MSELLIAAFTTFMGFLVYVMGQLIQSFLIEPIKEHNKLRGEISYALIMYANVGMLEKTPEEKELADEQKIYLRGLASELRRNLEVVPCYRFLSFLRIVTKRENVIEASNSLVGWSNSTYSGGSKVHRDSVAEAMNIDWRNKKPSKEKKPVRKTIKNLEKQISTLERKLAAAEQNLATQKSQNEEMPQDHHEKSKHWSRKD